MKNSSKTLIFLFELMFMMFIFAAASAVCIRIFAHSHTLSVQSRDTSSMITTIESVISAYKYTDGDLAKTAEYFAGGAAERNNNGFSVYYDSEWQVSSKDQAVYILKLTSSDDGVARISMDRTAKDGSDSTEIYTVSVTTLGV